MEDPLPRIRPLTTGSIPSTTDQNSLPWAPYSWPRTQTRDHGLAAPRVSLGWNPRFYPWPHPLHDSYIRKWPLHTKSHTSQLSLLYSLKVSFATTCLEISTKFVSVLRCRTQGLSLVRFVPTFKQLGFKSNYCVLNFYYFIINTLRFFMIWFDYIFSYFFTLLLEFILLLNWLFLKYFFFCHETPPPIIPHLQLPSNKIHISNPICLWVRNWNFF